MRFAACTSEDIEYLQSRTIGASPGSPNFNDEALHNVSIITGINAHKDKINELGSKRFAAESGQDLVDFFSEDCLGTNVDGAKRRPHEAKKRAAASVTNDIPNPIQNLLWHAHPSTTSYNIPGKLALCIGLPVMIRHNEATELCITKGQEGKIVGWQAARGQRKQRILDTLFIELTDPPRTVEVPGLPQNVVALTANKEKIWCNLPDDSTLQITRSQVPVLPNFAMTDYSSQGKTRTLNVVDLNNCKNHFSYYTALSRGTTSAGTVILQGADWGKITKGISGYLRQEFRELEALNEITRLRYETVLPTKVNGINRRELLLAFHSWNNGTFELANAHPALQSLPNEGPIQALPVLTGKWELIADDQKKFLKTHKSAKTPVPPTEKRPAEQTGTTLPVKKPKLSEPTPLGTKWDDKDYSCAYDALFTCMFDVWDEFRTKWSQRYREIGLTSSVLTDGFEAVHNKVTSLNNARDDVRALLTALEPEHFPRGQRLTVLDRLVHGMFGAKSWGTTNVKCTSCGMKSRNDCNVQCCMDITHNSRLITTHKSQYTVSHWFNSQWTSQSEFLCGVCSSPTITRISLRAAPPIWFMHLPPYTMRISQSLTLKVDGTEIRYLLRGVLYLGAAHFTSRIIRRTGQCWYHDGKVAEGNLECEGNLRDHGDNFLASRKFGSVVQRAVGVLYAVDEE
ncbi:hypothetical protein B0H12DRAFT_1273157 [Mycena haematopus]|nr:hypothetical protein B0H12DRAFT_1273157 [Mycena haematopus]